MASEVGALLYLLHGEGPDDVLRQQLRLDQRHLDVSVDLCVVGPVLAALDLKHGKHTARGPQHDV